MTDPTTPTVKDARITQPLYRNSILVDFCRQYLSVVDEIAAYNKEVLADSDSEWTSGKVLAKAREFAIPDDAEKADPEVKAVYSEWERLSTETSKARTAVIEMTSKKLGITLSATGVRNPELEVPMKERRKYATEIGNQLKTMAKFLTDAKVSEPVAAFLTDNPLPAVGRDQVSTFGTDEKSTPKYRVQVVVTDKEGAVKVDEAGFTKASQALAKFYPRGEAPKSDKLRSVWEAAGNTVENTVTNPVEFDDNELHFNISKR